ncbi:uncharacterized protein LOC134226219 [Armigeres subalbatus]|uniref:uncharacterized protein LOC134226219 n=1 Tax=Armigeres subalbatus TaxID=124917 RepID=UPI002ED2BE8C
MEYRGFYKNASRGNRLKEGNNQMLRSKRESSRQDLHFSNRNLNASDFLRETEDVHDQLQPEAKPRLSSGKKRRRRSRLGEEENKENAFKSKYEERLDRLKRFKEQRAVAKQKSVKKKPFVAVVSKNNLIDREYEKNLFKKSEEELKRLAEKRKLLTPAAKNATPRVDTRRKEAAAGEEKQQRARRNILTVKTPASIKTAKSKVDTWRKGLTPAGGNSEAFSVGKRERIATALKSRNGTAKKNVAMKKTTAPATIVSYRKGDAETAGSSSNMRYLEVRSGQKSMQFMFRFTKDGKIVTSTNRKKRRSLDKLQRPNAPNNIPLHKFSPKVLSDDDVFEGISPIDVDTPTPNKLVLDSEALAIRKRETRRRSMIFTVEDIKQEKHDDWAPQVITVSDDDSLVEVAVKTEPKVNQSFTVEPKLNESFTVEVKEEKIIDRRPTIDESPKLIGSGKKSFSGRPSLLFVEENNVPGVSTLFNNGHNNQIKKRNSLVFHEASTNAPKIATIEVFDSPVRTTMSPRRRSLTPRMSFVEEDVDTMTKPLPEGNLATVLLNKQQESKRRSSGGSRRSSLVNFREEDQPPTDVREKVVFYYNLVEKELQRLQKLCDLYKDDVDNEEIDENSKGLIIAAQGQTNILINKKLSKFKELVGHYERSWADQKVRTDDLDGFWLMVSLDLENLDRRFEELRLLKENNWQEIAEQPKTKKLKNGGGIKKREKKPMKTKASGLADLIKKAREEAKKKLMMEAALTETVKVVTPMKRSVRIATTPRRSSVTRNSICTGCTPTPGKSASKKSRKTIFNDHTLRKHEIVKSILKTPSEKRRAKSVLFLDSGLDTPEARPSGGRKIIHTPKPKITFNEELDVEDIEAISHTKLQNEIRKRRRSSLFSKECHAPEPQSEEEKEEPQCHQQGRRRTLRFSVDAAADEEAEQEEARDKVASPVKFDIEENNKAKRTRGKSRGRVSFQ